MKDDANMHIAVRFTEMRIAVKQSNALLNMYLITSAPGFLEEAVKLLGEFDESPPLPKIPYGQRDEEDLRRRMRNYEKEKRAEKVEQESPHICEHMLPQDLCQAC